MALTSQSLFFSPLVAGPSQRGQSWGRSASMSAAASHNSQPHNRLFAVLSSSPKSESETPKTLALACAVTAATSGAFLLASSGGGILGGGGVWGAGGGGAGGGFWSWVFSTGAANADEKSSGNWDPHGLPANISVPLTKLSGLKRYRVSELKFFDRAAAGGGAYTGPEDSSFEMVTLYPGGVYTKSKLLKELETLVSCGMFERVDLEGKAKPDGTLGLTVSFVESVWSAAKQFKCINVGLMAQSRQVDFDQDMTEREKMDFLRKQERDYQQRV